ncbi:hypothetical protein L916_12842 [Phytophthora nicotianae]|uniref:Uncharacterized protein n=1 Tax=Phytophthora nicotianae TaxID=4792 RepID=W2IL73_PHYNI|nr:hypothetical protein L916_12842 [Phytophthora nicotianae]
MSGDSDSESSDSSSSSSGDICGICGGTPCDWASLQELLVAQGDRVRDNSGTAPMKKIRMAVCQMYVYLKFGSLVKTRMFGCPSGLLRANAGNSISEDIMMLALFLCLFLVNGIPLVVRMTASRTSITAVFSVIMCL